MLFSPDMLKLEWSQPGPLASLAEIRKLFSSALPIAVTPEVFAVWGSIIPEKKHKEVHRQIRSGVKRGLTALLLPPGTENLGARVRLEILSMPSYWEPPVSGNGEPSWPSHQLQAYRWTAAVIGYAIRNQLEQLHADYTSDDEMPELNRRIRNAVYTVLLQYSAEAWRLTNFPRAVLETAALGISSAHVPAVAG